MLNGSALDCQFGYFRTEDTVLLPLEPIFAIKQEDGKVYISQIASQNSSNKEEEQSSQKGRTLNDSIESFTHLSTSNHNECDVLNDLYWKENSGNFLDSLESLWKKEVRNQEDRILLGFFAYNFAASLEPLVADDRKGLLGFPQAFFVVFNKHTFLPISEFEHNLGIDSKKRSPTGMSYSSCLSTPLTGGEELRSLGWQKESPQPPLLKGEESEARRGITHLEEIKFKSLIQDNEYQQMVEDALELIKEGQLYEINLSRPFLTEIPKELKSLEIAKKLLENNPAPFASYFPFGSNKSIISASPECFLKKTNNKVHTYPIKGTRKRSALVKEDNNLAQELLSSKKELAEHLMVVDLERNDLGRVAIPSSVKVKEFAQLVSYEFVHHLVSDISCELPEDLNIFEVIKAMFPSGSITGAPKIRTMQAIKSLEPFPREAYTGALGYIDSKGDSTFSILIRSLFRDREKLVVNVGGGIVADSCPLFECEETYVKMKGLVNL